MRNFLVWCVRFLIPSIFVPGALAAVNGKALDGIMRGLEWPIAHFVNMTPSLNALDLYKWLYTTLVLFVELMVVAGIVYAILELAGKLRISHPSMVFIAHLLAQVEVGIYKSWGLLPHECRFYWLVATKKDYDYFTSHQHLNEEDRRVIKRAFSLNQNFKADHNLRRDSPTHPAHQYVFLRNGGTFRAGLIVFINKPKVLDKAAIDTFTETVEPIISLDGTKEIMLVLTKKRGVIVV